MFRDDDKATGDVDADTLDGVTNDMLEPEDEDNMLGGGLDGDSDDS